MAVEPMWWTAARRSAPSAAARRPISRAARAAHTGGCAGAARPGPAGALVTIPLRALSSGPTPAQPPAGRHPPPRPDFDQPVARLLAEHPKGHPAPWGPSPARPAARPAASPGGAFAPSAPAAGSSAPWYPASARSCRTPSAPRCRAPAAPPHRKEPSAPGLRGRGLGGSRMRVFGVVGWKNNGKTTLVERLVEPPDGARLPGLDRQARPPRGRSRPAGQGQLAPSRGGRSRGGARHRAALGRDPRVARRARAAARRPARTDGPGGSGASSRASSASRTPSWRSTARERGTPLLARDDPTSSPSPSTSRCPTCALPQSRPRRRAGHRRLDPPPPRAWQHRPLEPLAHDCFAYRRRAHLRRAPPTRCCASASRRSSGTRARPLPRRRAAPGRAGHQPARRAGVRQRRRRRLRLRLRRRHGRSRRPPALGARPCRRRPSLHAAAARTALRVLTGAPMPARHRHRGAAGGVRARGRPRRGIPAGLKRGANRRRAGEDVRAGQPCSQPGTRLRPQEIGARRRARASPTLAGVRAARVAILSTGDELVEPGPARAGARLRRQPAHPARRCCTAAVAVTDLGIAPRRARWRSAPRWRPRPRHHHVVLTSGGASRGDEDHVVRSVAALGRLDFWQIAMKPGRPLAFGRLGEAVFVGLPGNPVAAMVCFLLFARPVLLRLGGARGRPRCVAASRPAFGLRKQAGRSEYLRARLERDAGRAPAGPAGSSARARAS